MVLAELGVVTIHDKTALPVAKRVQTLLHVFAQEDILPHQHIPDVVHEALFEIRRLADVK